MNDLACLRHSECYQPFGGTKHLSSLRDCTVRPWGLHRVAPVLSFMNNMDNSPVGTLGE